MPQSFLLLLSYFSASYFACIIAVVLCMRCMNFFYRAQLVCGRSIASSTNAWRTHKSSWRTLAKQMHSNDTVRYPALNCGVAKFLGMRRAKEWWSMNLLGVHFFVLMLGYKLAGVGIGSDYIFLCLYVIIHNRTQNLSACRAGIE